MRTDPISDQFPWVSSYNYAENRVPNGIDLHGLQFLHHSIAKINFGGSGAYLKLSNMSRPTQHRARYAQVYIDGNNNLTSTFPLAIGSLNFSSGEVLERRRATDNSPGITSEYSNQTRRTAARELNVHLPRVESLSRIPNGKGGRGVGLLWAISEGLNALTNYTVNSDLNAAKSQYGEYGEDISFIIKDAKEDGIIPSDFTNQMLGDVANYIFQGEILGRYNGEIYQQVIRIAQELLKQNEIECRECEK